MMAHWQYLKYVLRHKWFVFLACLEIGGLDLVVRGVFHDWDKFLPDEWFPYARFFYNPDGTRRQRRDKSGYYKPDDTGDASFDYAWFLHQKRNKHHWQWWCLPTESGIKTLPMPDVYRREMLADWKGAGRAQGTPDTRAWYLANTQKMQLHEETRSWIEEQLAIERD